MKTKLQDATATQIAEYGSTVLNLPNMTHTRGKAVLLSEIGRTGVTPETEIEVGGTPEEVAAATPAVPTERRRPDPEDIVTIVIPQQEIPGGNEPKWVACNDKGMWIPRDQEVSVKYKYVEVLENAVKTIYDTDEMGNRIGSRQVPATPFRRVA